MPNEPGSLPADLDRIDVERLAVAAGLPPALAARVAQVVVESGLPHDRRREVFDELVAHFQDGLAAGQTAESLAATFGDHAQAATLIRQQKRVVTPEARGGTGPSDGLLTRLARDGRYAVRRLLARPAFTLMAVASLALGIGANAAMFTLVNEVILRKPPFRAPEELVELYGSDANDAFDPFSYPDFEDFSRGTGEVFTGLGGARLGILRREDGDRIERLAAELVTGNYFELLGVRPLVGRLIEASDAPAPGQGSVVVLSERYWRRAFGADPRVLGRVLRIQAANYTIVGVVPAAYQGVLRGFAIEVYAPLMKVDDLFPTLQGELTQRGNHSIFVKGRLRPGVTLERARVAVATVAADLRGRFPDQWRADAGAKLVPTKDVILFPPIDRLLVPVAWMLMVVVGLVLAIACANLAAFLLARAVDRRKEIAVRLALGASRGQLVSQLLVETVLLALVGGGVGVLFGRAALRAVLAIDLPVPVPLGLDLPIDARVLGFSIGVSILAGMLFGLAPALQSTRLDLVAVIRDESTGAGGGGRHKGLLRAVLVGGQVAVSVVLLVAAGLFVRSLNTIKRVDPGFGNAPGVLAWIAMAGKRNNASLIRTLETVERRVAAIPGVRSVGAVENIHLSLFTTSGTELAPDGIDAPPGRPTVNVDRTDIDTGFVVAAGMRLLRGRNFTAQDDSAAPRVALVNEAFAKRFLPGREAVGQRIRYAGWSRSTSRSSGGQVMIVGVLNTAKIRTLGEEPRPFLYTPLAQSPATAVWLLAQTDGDAESMVTPVLRAIREADPEIFPLETRTMRRHLEVMSLPITLGAATLGAFALLALALAGIGLYGTVSYSVAQRSREVGIRLSLGAARGAVVRLLLWGGLRVVLIGGAIGMVLALVLARLLEGLLFGVRAFDPVTFGAVPAFLVGVAILAAWFPARRAGRIDPVTALRAE